jgi:hypothetical protein
MSTSLLYHGFGAKGYNFLAYNFVNGNIIIKIEPKAKLLRCSCCGNTDVIKRGSFKRIIRTIPIGNKI